MRGRAHTALVARRRWVETIATDAGVHPDLVRRLVALGFLDGEPDAALRVGRALRLRRDLGLNYAGALLAVELLDRIEVLEERLRRYEAPNRSRR